MNKFQKVQKDVEEVLKKSPLEFDLIHSRKVLYWLLKLKPDADEILKIAAIAHDIERGMTGITEITHLKNYDDIKNFKKQHAKRSASFAINLLEKYNYSKREVLRLKKLIENHEEGGDEETNILMGADSIAYFDYNVEFGYKKSGKERTMGKIKFMFERAPYEAKEIIRNLNYKNKDVEVLIKDIILPQ